MSNNSKDNRYQLGAGCNTQEMRHLNILLAPCRESPAHPHRIRRGLSIVVLLKRRQKELKFWRKVPRCRRCRQSSGKSHLDISTGNLLVVESKETLQSYDRLVHSYKHQFISISYFKSNLLHFELKERNPWSKLLYPHLTNIKISAWKPQIAHIFLNYVSLWWSRVSRK